jgi:hypothetical protein
MARCAAMQNFFQSRAALKTGFSSPPHSLHTASAAHPPPHSKPYGEGDAPHFRNTVPEVERPLSQPAPNVASGRLWAPIRICAVSDSHLRGFRLAFRAVSDSHFARFQTRISRGFRLAFRAVSDSHLRGFRLAFRAVSDSHFMARVAPRHHAPGSSSASGLL